jgi:Domain of unknown function (DUF1772)
MTALRLADGIALLLFASIYLGTGVTLVFFIFPIGPKLTPDTYRLPFVEPVQNATRFFTVMTILMLVGSIGLIALEYGNARLLLPAAYLLATLAATLLTTQRIIPINKRMAAGISDNAELQALLGRWARLNTIRGGLWGVEWVAIAAWWVVLAA